MAHQSESARPRALLIDWGGVLTSNLFVSFHAYCVRAGIDPRKLVGRFLILLFRQRPVHGFARDDYL